MPIDNAHFRQVMGHFASGVTVVTTLVRDTPYGLTVSSFTSLSLVPPLVAICVDRSTAGHDAISSSGIYAVNILAQQQEHLSRQFASREANKFASVGYVLSENGLPLLEGALATVECRLWASYDGGDHTIFVGEVLAADCQDATPLVYFRRGYRALR